MQPNQTGLRYDLIARRQEGDSPAVDTDHCSSFGSAHSAMIVSDVYANAIIWQCRNCS